MSLETFANPTYSQDKEVHLTFRQQDKSIKKMKRITTKKDALRLMAIFFSAETCVHMKRYGKSLAKAAQ